MRIAALFLLVLLCACGSTPVAEDLSQQQANQIVALLSEYGINADASRASSKSGYSVKVNHRHEQLARSLLDKNNLPAQAQAGFDQLLEQKGFIPNSRQVDQLRMDRALAVELETAISAISGVAEAKAIVRYNFTSESKTSAVSLVVRTQPGHEVDPEAIRKIAQQVFPGITSENLQILIDNDSDLIISDQLQGKVNKDGEVISVSLVPFIVWDVPAGQHYELAISLLAFLLLVGLVGFSIGYFVSEARQRRGFSERNIDNPSIASIRLDSDRQMLE